MKLKSLAFANLVFCGVIFGLTVSSASADPARIFIVTNESRQEIGRCAKALLESTDLISDEKIDAKIISYEEYEAITKREDAGWQNKKSRLIFVNLDQRSDDLALHGIPFAFTDAAHYLAYLQSPLLPRFDRNLGVGRESILAYGGFSQLFSRIAAVTTPKHFYRRRISGDAQGLLVYHEFGGDMGIALPGMMTSDLAQAFQRMKSGHVLYDIVEAPLGAAFAAGADHIARFASLSSTSVESIKFSAEGDVLYFPKLKLSNWQRAAALRCSKENFATELAVLEKFKQAGVQVAPFDRAALVETARRLWLERPHPYWTIADFDELASLAAPAGKSPSQIVAALPAKRKAAALRFDDEARKEHAKSLEGHEPRGEAIDAVLTQYRARLAADVRSMPLPSPPSGKPDRPKAVRKFWSNYDQIAKLTASLEQAARNCEKCHPISLEGAWAILARADFVLGKTNEAAAALDRLFAVVKPTDYRYRLALRAAASVGDARAKAPIANMCDKALSVASSNVKADKFPFLDVLSCVYLLSDIDEDDKARALVKLATSYAATHGRDSQFPDLANAQWYVGDLQGARQSLMLSMRLTGQSGFPTWSWPLLRLPGPEFIEANRPFLNLVESYFLSASDALYPAAMASPPRKQGRYQEWSDYMSRAIELEHEYKMKDQLARNLLKIRDVAKSLPGDERAAMLESFAAYLNPTDELDNPDMTSSDPETRMTALGAAVAQLANFAQYFN